MAATSNRDELFGLLNLSQMIERACEALRCAGHNCRSLPSGEHTEPETTGTAVRTDTA